MKKIKEVLLLISVFLIMFTVKVYAEDVQVLITENEKTIASGENVVDVILQADEDIRRSSI